MPPKRNAAQLKVTRRVHGRKVTRTTPVRHWESNFLPKHKLRQIVTCLGEVDLQTSSPPIVAADILQENITDNITDEKGRRTRYIQYRDRKILEWQSSRDSLLAGACLSFQQPPDRCSTCGSQEAIYCCPDCGPTMYQCEKCSQEDHSLRPFHIIYKWQNCAWVRSPQLSVPVLGHSEHVCTSTYPEYITVFNNEGHPVSVICRLCNCEGIAVSLGRWQLWPVDVKKPTVAFTFRFLEWMRYLILECHVSKSAFIEMVALKNQLTHEQKNWLKGALHSETFEEYRFMKYRQSTMQHVLSQLDDGTSCPACPVENTSSDANRCSNPIPTNSKVVPIISMDANFGLVRKKSSGLSCITSAHGTRLFMEDTTVKTYLSNCTDDKTKVPGEDCNNFQAGNKVRSKIKNAKLDVTGIFGSVCRHEMPQLFIDLEFGERLAYPCMLLQEWFARHSTTDEANVFYDIACVLKKFLQKSEDGQQLLSKIHLAIPAFHCYGHQTTCQILYSPRRQVGFATTDGEAMERLWSYLRPFGRITKEMTATHRRDLLTEALLHYGMKKKLNLAVSLRNRARASTKEVMACGDKLAEYMAQFKGVTPETLAEWADNQKHAVQVAKATKHAEKPQCWEETYVQDLIRLNIIRTQMVSTGDTALTEQHKSLSASLQQVEKKHLIEKRWDDTSPQFQHHKHQLEHRQKTSLLQQMQLHARERSFLLSLQRKYSDGQAIFIRLNRQIIIACNKIKKLARTYNAGMFGVGPLPDTVQELEMLDPTATTYSLLDVITPLQTPQMLASCPSPGLVQEVLDLHHRLQRAEEENELIRLEVNCICQYINGQCTVLYGALSERKSFNSGEIALLIRKVTELEEYYLFVKELFVEEFGYDLPAFTSKFTSKRDINNTKEKEESDCENEEELGEGIYLPYDTTHSSDSEDEPDEEIEI